MLFVNFTLSSPSTNLSLIVEADTTPPPSTYNINLTYIEYTLISALIIITLSLWFRWQVKYRRRPVQDHATSVRFNHGMNEFKLANLPTPLPCIHFPSDPCPSLFIPRTPSPPPKSDALTYREEERSKQYSFVSSSKDHTNWLDHRPLNLLPPILLGV